MTWKKNKYLSFAVREFIELPSNLLHEIKKTSSPKCLSILEEMSFYN